MTNERPGFNAIVNEILHRFENGEMVDRDEVLRVHSAYADELRKFFDEDSRWKPSVGSSAVDTPTLDVSLSSETDAQLELTMDSHAPNASQVTPRFSNFGDYELHKEIARGGMGVVYKARQVNLDRNVALKMILSGQLAGEDDIRRFYQEAESAAKLEHPGIVPIYEVGQHQGQHFFSMALVEGPSLAELLMNGSLPPREAAAVVRHVADAIAFAHASGVIHRDLKPANILMSRHDERIGGGSSKSAISISGASVHPNLVGVYEPKVTDFGLAKRTDSASELTGTGQILGTPNYMPPEQASGDAKLIGPAADIYSLGAILFCVLTGRPPFQAANPMDTLMQVIANEPPTPRQLNPDIPQDLETICLKCLEKEPHKRYASTQDLVDELDRWLADKPILARPVGPIERGYRWCRRNPMVAALLMLVALSLAGGTAVATRFAIKANNRAAAELEQRTLAEKQTDIANHQRKIAEQQTDLARKEQLAAKAASQAEAYQRRQAEQQRELAQQNERESQWNLYVARLFPMQAAWEQQNFGQLQQLLDDSIPEKDEPDYRGWEWYYFQDQCRQASRLICEEGMEDRALDWSMEGILALGVKKKVEIYKGDFEAPLHVLKPGEDVRRLSFSADGRWLACAMSTKLAIWDMDTEEWCIEWDVEGIHAIHWSPDGKKIATCGWNDPSIEVWDTSSGEMLQTLSTDIQRMCFTWDLRWHPDGVRLATANRFGILTVFDVDTGKILISKNIGDNETSPLDSVDWSPDGKYLASTNDSGLVILDAELQVVARRKGYFKLGRVRWSPDGKFAAAAGRGQSIHFWSHQEKSFRKESVHGKPIRGLVWSPDSSRIVVSGGGQARLVTVDRREVQNRVQKIGKTFGENFTRWSHDGTTLMATSNQEVAWYRSNVLEAKKLRIWGTRSARDEPISGFQCGDWTNERQIACVATSEGVLHVFDTNETAKFKRIKSLNLKEHVSTTAEFHPDGIVLAIGIQGGDTMLLDTKSWASVRKFGKDVNCLSWSPDGRSLATGNRNGLQVWDAKTAKLRFGNKTMLGSDVSWRPDGGLVSAASSTGVIQFFRNDGKSMLATKAHIGPVYSIAWSPDGRRFATTGEDQTLAIWDGATGMKLVSLPIDSAAFDVNWSPDGRMLACVCKDGTLRLFGTPQLELPPTDSTFLKTGVLAISAAEKEKEIEQAPNEQLNEQILEGTGIANDMAFSSDGRWLVVGGSKGTVNVWDVASGETIHALHAHSGAVLGVGIGPNDQRIISCNSDGLVRIWDRTTGENTLTLEGHEARVWSADFSPDGRRIVSCSSDKTLRIWGSTKGEEIMTLKGHVDEVRAVAFSPDGKWIASGSHDETVKIWDAESGEELRTLSRQAEGSINSLAISSDNRLIVGGSIGTISVWDAETGVEVLTLRGHPRKVNSVAFSPDSDRIASGGIGQKLRVWDAKNGQLLRSYRRDGNVIRCLTFSPDGTRIASGGEEMKIKLFDVVPAKETKQN